MDERTAHDRSGPRPAGHHPTRKTHCKPFTRTVLHGLGMAMAAAILCPQLALGDPWMDAGEKHTCSLTPIGGVRCWGGNDYRQIGDGTTTDRYTPVDVPGLTSGMAMLASGNKATCALATQGGVTCWGDWNGNDGKNGAPAPIAITVYPDGSGVKAISIGDLHICTITAADTVQCWGYN